MVELEFAEVLDPLRVLFPACPTSCECLWFSTLLLGENAHSIFNIPNVRQEFSAMILLYCTVLYLSFLQELDCPVQH